MKSNKKVVSRHSNNLSSRLQPSHKQQHSLKLLRSSRPRRLLQERQHHLHLRLLQRHQLLEECQDLMDRLCLLHLQVLDCQLEGLHLHLEEGHHHLDHLQLQHQATSLHLLHHHLQDGNHHWARLVIKETYLLHHLALESSLNLHQNQKQLNLLHQHHQDLLRHQVRQLQLTLLSHHHLAQRTYHHHHLDSANLLQDLLQLLKNRRWNQRLHHFRP